MPPDLNFCTYFDSNYVIKALTLHATLVEHSQNFHLYMLCLDESAFLTIQSLQLDHVTAISLSDVERFDAELYEKKGERGIVEYYWTITPILPAYIFENFPHIREIIYLDSDLGFYSDPVSLYEELGDHSIFIVPHRFPPQMQDRGRTVGEYNVGVVGFKNNPVGRECLAWWREQCLDSCAMLPEEGKYGDQKYLDQFTQRFTDIAISRNIGCNAAPYNISQWNVTCVDGQVFIEDNQLVCFHFHGLRRLGSHLYELAPAGYRLRPTDRDYIYQRYVQRMSRLRRDHPTFATSQRTGGGKRQWAGVLLGLTENRLLWQP